MKQTKRWSSLALVAPLAICLPCLLLPLATIGGAALLSALGGLATGSLVLAAVVLVVGAAVAAGLYLRRRRADQSPDTCCPIPTNSPETAAHARSERPEAVGSALN